MDRGPNFVLHCNPEMVKKEGVSCFFFGKILKVESSSESIRS